MKRRAVATRLAVCVGIGVLGLGFWAYTRPDFVVSLASLSFLCQ